MTIALPKAPNAYSLPIWNQKNDSDVNGSLWATTGIDLSENEGKVRLGKRLLLATGQVDDVDMNNYPVAFRQFTDDGGQFNWTVMGSYVWKGFSQATATAVKDAHTGFANVSPDSTVSDIEVFNNEIYVSGTRSDSSIFYLASTGNWQFVANFGFGNISTSFCLFQNRLYLGGGQSVKSIDTSHTVASPGSAYAVTIPDTGLAITFIRAGSNRIWIGTVNAFNQKGYIYEWDGVATQVTKSYRLESIGAFACVIKDDIPYVMDANGKLLMWNGGTFTELAKLNKRTNKILGTTQSVTTNRYIHKNGMSLIQGRINMLIRGTNMDGTIEETIPSGIYEYDSNRGLTCKHTFGTAKLAGTIQDYGQINVKNVGALAELNNTDNNVTNSYGFLVGATYYSDATTVKGGIFYNDLNDTLQKGGSLITTKQYAIDAQGNPSVQNAWQNIYILYKKLLDSADKIVVKYRCTEIEPIIATITWTGTTTFTVLNSAVDVSQYWTLGTGGEVDILNGIGAGKPSHITNAVNNAGTWTVTVDETYTGATGTAKARFQLWKKLGVINYTNTTLGGITYDQEGIGDVSNWVQFKIFMLFTGRDELEKLLIINKDFNPAD